MKIVYVAASIVPSNAANSIAVMKACQAMVQLGHQVHLFVPKPESQPDVNLQEFYGLHVSFPIEWLSANIRLRRYDLGLQAVRRARALQADLIYTRLPQAALFAPLSGIPLIMEVHNPPEGRFGPYLYRLLLHLPGKKRLLPITHAMAELLRNRGLPLETPDGRLSFVIAPSGIDLERYANLPEPPAARRILGLADMPTAVYTGHLYAGRGTTLLAALARRLPAVQFLWVGGRESDVHVWRNRLLAEHLTNVHLTGFIQNSFLPRYQAAAEVLLMPYERVIAVSSGGNTAGHASPMKMFEYMACRRAILSSDLPVLREVLNEHNTVFCPPEDVDAWQAALESLLADEPRRSTLANQAWQDVQPYTWLERQRRVLEGFLR